MKRKDKELVDLKADAAQILQAWHQESRARFEANDVVGGLSILERAWVAQPTDVLLHRSLGEIKQILGDTLAAQAHFLAADTLQAHAAHPAVSNALPIYNIATGYLLLGDNTNAEHWYQLTLMIDPNLATAHQNIAVINEEAGQTELAASHRAQAYAIQRVFIEPAAGAPRRVLILCTGGLGNVPIETLLPPQTSYRIKYIIDYATVAEDLQLPRFDLVFNAIGDPDTAEPLFDRLQYFIDHCDQPILNSPVAVSRTLRHNIGELLGGIPNTIIPACFRIEAGIACCEYELIKHLAAAGITYPVLARPAGMHGGKGLVRCESTASLLAVLRSEVGHYYVSQYYDYCSGDGFYRKYRMIFVDREPFPYHLAVSLQWMVHYFSADMVEHAWKIEEERQFLENPGAVLGQNALASIAAIGRQLELDYCGIDFACLPDGRVLVFETNATMLVHFEPNGGALAHKNPYVQCVVDAFERLQQCHISRSPVLV